MRTVRGLAVLAAAGWCAAAAVAAPPPTVDAYGTWSLVRLGASPLHLAPGAAATTVPFAFPAGARQGPAAWFLGDLDATVSLAHPATGAVYLDAGVGAWDWAQVRIRTTRRRGRVVTEWSSATLSGIRSGSARGLTAHIAVTNFLPTPAVAAGPATLTFRLVHYGALHATSATVGPASGLEYSTAGPPHLVARLTAPRVGRVGGTGVAVVSLTNSGDRPVRAVGIEWTTGGRVAVIGSPPRVDLAPHRTVHVPYRLRFLRRGVATVYVEAAGSGGGATSSAVVRITG